MPICSKFKIHLWNFVYKLLVKNECHFLFWIISLCGVMPLLKVMMEFCNQDISTRITALENNFGEN